MEALLQLFITTTGEDQATMKALTPAGSNRRYYRISSSNHTLIGVQGNSLAENKAFITLANHFFHQGLPVPQIKAVSADGLCYLQSDLGDVSLFDRLAADRKSGCLSGEVIELLKTTVRMLPHFQVKGGQGLDFTICFPQPEFNHRSVLWDLNYFKYSFLKASGIEFEEDRLEDEFLFFAQNIVRLTPTGFVYRDFQSRNIMLVNNQPYGIDFQGGRKGPLAYDIVSFLWQAKAAFPPQLREELLEEYVDELQKLMPVDELQFRKQLPLIILFRTLQVLGAYGFRGYIEKKQHFIESIPYAIANLAEILEQDFSDYPYLTDVLRIMVQQPQFAPISSTDGLTVTITSFSYKLGIPEDKSGNGGGFVFDCRAMHNPGRYKEYKELTGLDQPVKEFLEGEREVQPFLESAFLMISSSVEIYMNRGFTDLMVSYGCTGGQHRSVYCAQKTAEYLHQRFGVRINLVHREQHIHQQFPKMDLKI